RSTILKTPLPVPAMSPTGAALRQGAWRRDGRGGGFSLRSDLRGYDFLQGCENMLSLMLVMHRSCVVTAARSGGAEAPAVGELFDRSSGHGEGRAPAARSSLCDPAGGGNFPAAFAIDLLERKGMTVCSERFGNCSKIGRASCRERVEIAGGEGPLKKRDENGHGDRTLYEV